MNPGAIKTRTARHAPGLIIFFIVALSFFAGLGRRELWNPVEPRYAGICAELLREGSWLVPTYNGAHYDQKPPLFFWVGAALLSLGEEDETRRFLVRLPSALGGLALVLGTLAVGSRLFGARTGRWAAALCATSWLPFWSSRFCHLDTLSAAAVIWTVYGLERARQDQGAARAKWIAVAAATLGAGIMTKGLGAWVLVVGVALALAIARRSARGLIRSGLPWVAALALVPVAAWFLAAWHEAGDAWAKGLGVDAGILHILDPDKTIKHGPGYYLGVIWGLAAPWSLFLPFAIWSPAGRGGDEVEADGRRFCLAYLLGVLAVLYIGTTYRSRYLLPALPAIHILVARYLVREAFEGRGFGGRIAGGLARLMPFGSNADLGARREVGFAVVPIALALLFGAWGWFGATAVDSQRGDRGVVEDIRPLLAAGRRLAAVESYAVRESTAGYYGFSLDVELGVVDVDGKQSAELLRREPIVLLARPRDLEVYPDCISAGWKMVHGPRGRRQVCIYLNPWPPPPR